MLNIKNFSLVEPTQEQKEKFINPEGITPQFLRSEDGLDWYECQCLFKENTIKVMYDAKGIIRSVITKPLPERGGGLSVSAFFPLNMSVAEIEGPLPDGFSINGGWTFNGREIEPYTFNTQEIIAKAEEKKSRLMESANKTIAPLQYAVELDMATDEEARLLSAWKKYSVLLNRVDTSDLDKIEWPAPPL